MGNKKRVSTFIVNIAFAVITIVTIYYLIYQLVFYVPGNVLAIPISMLAVLFVFILIRRIWGERLAEVRNYRIRTFFPPVFALLLVALLDTAFYIGYRVANPVAIFDRQPLIARYYEKNKLVKTQYIKVFIDEWRMSEYDSKKKMLEKQTFGTTPLINFTQNFAFQVNKTPNLLRVFSGKLPHGLLLVRYPLPTTKKYFILGDFQKDGNKWRGTVLEDGGSDITSVTFERAK
ncbi:hypothetical protein [Lacticaseibacillus mingshuiensis]|uniref:hypothetical protein n=1 Tax=Lacticaseibacillus mingshuiensis TaxID=2799574 RepID=UPI00194E6E71|nr:hypothetical protein [Lacticaseibacillus mingshuiensis]